MTFTQSVRLAMRDKYATFSGRSTRSEYWWFHLFTMIVFIALITLFMVTGGGAWMESFFAFSHDPNTTMAPLGAFPKLIIIAFLIFALALIIPSIAIVIRRLHDRDMSGWWYLGLMVPLLQFYPMIVIMFLRGTNGDNRFGADPLA